MEKDIILQGIKSIDIYNGNVTTELALTKSEVIDMMYLVEDKKEIWYSVNDKIFIFDIYNRFKSEYCEEEGLKKFIPAYNTIIEVQKDGKKGDIIFNRTSLSDMVYYNLRNFEEVKCLNGDIKIKTYSIVNGYLEFEAEDNYNNSVKFRISIAEGNPRESYHYLVYIDSNDSNDSNNSDKGLSGWYVRNYYNILSKRFGFDELNLDYSETIIEDINNVLNPDENKNENKIIKIQLSSNKNIKYDEKTIQLSCDNEDDIVYKSNDEKATINNCSFDIYSKNIYFFEGNNFITLGLDSGNIDKIDLLKQYKECTKEYYESERDNNNEEKINQLDNVESIEITKMYAVKNEIVVVLINGIWYRIKSNRLNVLGDSNGNMNVILPIQYYYCVILSDDLKDIYVFNIDEKQFTDSKNYYEDLKNEIIGKGLINSNNNISLKLEKIIYDRIPYAIIVCTDTEDNNICRKVKLDLYRIKDSIYVYEYNE